VDINGISGGEATLVKTVLPVRADANVSIRLAPGQEPDEIAASFERILRGAAPAGADLEIVHDSTRSGVVPAEAPAVRLAQDAFESVVGTRPVLIRTGGSAPIMPALADKGVPVILTGFALPNGNIHAPNERLTLEYLPVGVATARELFSRFAALR
jgi:acetylornithine deacetylase/succinyl-diaminopimelate desuccinylase-like protein